MQPGQLALAADEAPGGPGQPPALAPAGLRVKPRMQAHVFGGRLAKEDARRGRSAAGGWRRRRRIRPEHLASSTSHSSASCSSVRRRVWACSKSRQKASAWTSRRTAG